MTRTISKTKDTTRGRWLSDRLLGEVTALLSDSLVACASGGGKDNEREAKKIRSAIDKLNALPLARKIAEIAEGK